MAKRPYYHRPVRAGIKIASARTNGSDIEPISSGTLTGVATKNGTTQKVLVTAQHVMSDGGLSLVHQPLEDDEEMYQPNADLDANKIGHNVQGSSVSRLGSPIDAAYCEVINDADVSFWLHDEPSHTNRVLIADTVKPEVDMAVKILGLTNGEYDATITRINHIKVIGGLPNTTRFTNLFTIDWPSEFASIGGDSGAPVLKETSPGSGKFQLVGYVFSDDELFREINCLPASIAESRLGITFGKRPTTMHVFASPTNANVGDTVFLNGSGSLDPDGGDLTFLWEQIEGQDVENFLTTNTSIASFTVPEGGYGSLRFRLTATDEYNLESAREVIVNRNPVAKIAEVADAGYLEEVTLDGRQSVDYARSTEQDIAQLTYLWQQVFDSDPEEAQTPKVTLTGANTASASFTTPAENHRLKFKLTVTDRNNLSHSAEVIINVENKPPVADAGEDAYVEVSTAAPLDGSGSSDEDHQLDELSFNWQAPAESGVTILNPDHMETSFLAPSTAGDIEFTLTVTDPHEASATDTVTKMVRVFTWSEWQDVDPLETRVSLLNADEFEKKQFRTSDYGTTQYQWVPDPEGTWGPWTPTGNHQGCGPDRQAEESRTSSYQNVQTRFVADPEPKTWSEWMDTGEDRGCGSGREAEQSRISHCGDSETRWVSDPEDDPWGPWKDTGDYSGCGPNRQKEQERTSKCGRSDSQWVAAPEPDPWGSWTNTSEYQGCGPDRRRKQTRTSKCGRSDSQWVAAPEPDPWGSWTNTNEYQGCGPDRRRKQTRTSKCGRSDSQWVAAPEPDPWGSWTNTSEYQGCGPDRRRKQTRTSKCGRSDSQWVAAPEPDPWGSWTNTSEYQGCGPDRQRKQTRTSKCGRSDSQWVDSPVDETWGEWEDTGEVRGILDARSKKQKRTSDCNNIEYPVGARHDRVGLMGAHGRLPGLRPGPQGQGGEDQQLRRCRRSMGPRSGARGIRRLDRRRRDPRSDSMRPGEEADPHGRLWDGPDPLGR